MKIKVILNPYANRWRAGSRLEEVQQGLYGRLPHTRHRTDK